MKCNKTDKWWWGWSQHRIERWISNQDDRWSSNDDDNNNNCTADPRETTFLYQRILMVIQRFNAVCLANTITVSESPSYNHSRHTFLLLLILRPWKWSTRAKNNNPFIRNGMLWPLWLDETLNYILHAQLHSINSRSFNPLTPPLDPPCINTVRTTPRQWICSSLPYVYSDCVAWPVHGSAVSLVIPQAMSRVREHVPGRSILAS